jgi:hypothetical protein
VNASVSEETKREERGKEHRGLSGQGFGRA